MKSDSMVCELLTSTDVSPVSGWGQFTKQLFSLGITEIPDMRMIKNYPEIADGDGIAIEIGKKKKYRFYGYQQPAAVKKIVPQAGKIEAIMDLTDVELKIKRLRKF